jgi:NAD-dependent DNA ligase
MLQKYLMLSYCYYIRNVSLVSDEEYDVLAKQLLLNWDSFEHQHKYLVSKEDLEAGTLYHLSALSYPLMVIHAAEIWMKKGK